MNYPFPSSSISRSTWQFVTLQTGPLAKVVLSSMTRAATLSPTIFDISSQHSYFHRGGLVSYYVCIVWSLLADCHIYDKLFSLRIEHGGTLVFKRSPIYSTAPCQMSKILVCRWPPAIRGVWPVATVIIETVRETTSYFNSFFFLLRWVCWTQSSVQGDEGWWIYQDEFSATSTEVSCAFCATSREVSFAYLMSWANSDTGLKRSRAYTPYSIHLRPDPWTMLQACNYHIANLSWFR